MAKVNLSEGYKNIRTRKMRKAEMAEAMHINALRIQAPTGYSADAETRKDAKGQPISRQALRDYRRSQKAKAVKKQ